MNGAPFEIETTPKVKLDVFLPEIRMLTPGCPDEIIASYVRQAVIELSDKALALKREQWIQLQVGVREYLLAPDDCVRVVAIDWVCDETCGGRRYVPTPHLPCNIQCSVSACWPTCGPGQFVGFGFEAPQWVSFKQPNSFFVSFMPKCDMGIGMRVRMSVAPTRDACEIDQIIYEKYAQDIHAGAASYLLLMQGQSWYQPQLGSIMQKRWLTAQGKIAGDAMIQESRGPFSVRAQRIV